MKKGCVVPLAFSHTGSHSELGGVVGGEGGGAVKGLVDLNYQDLHGNDDCLFMLAEWEGRKSLAERPVEPLWMAGRSHGLNFGKIFPNPFLSPTSVP